jgi:hypothetical protein
MFGARLPRSLHIFTCTIRGFFIHSAFMCISPGFSNVFSKGRSPYEAPETPSGSSTDGPTSTTRRISPLHADEYVQHYDERGHPVNPESKSFGKELRRAKNDILSTMGIVVSEDANRGRNEQQKIDAIVAENDYGLIMVTLDQISVFLGSWWTTSLTGRIQVSSFWSICEGWLELNICLTTELQKLYPCPHHENHEPRACFPWSIWFLLCWSSSLGDFDMFIYLSASPSRATGFHRTKLLPEQ